MDLRVEVEVWRVDLAHARPPSAAELAVLSEEERARHARYLVAEPANAFATTRIALRRLLGQRLGRAAAAVRLVADQHGKPAVVGSSSPFFNVSHGPTCALIALSEIARVGVDVESRTALAFDSPAAQSACTPAEMAWLQAHRAPADVTIARVWCRKEAVLKACGRGLTWPMTELDLGIPGATEGLCEVPHLGRMAWRDLVLPFGELGAVAVCSNDATGITTVVRPYVARQDS